jgi:16S rRNA (uracil1498-N3)-methyltransferase
LTPSKPSNPHLLAPLQFKGVLAVGETIALDVDQMNKLAFREVHVKEAFTIVSHDGTFFRASLKSASPTEGSAVVYEQMGASTESPARITLVCAVLGRQRMITVVQKATELGCVRVVPVFTEHSVQPADLEKEKPWAWPGQAIKASRQCRRASVPEVLSVLPLETALAATYWKDARGRFSMDDREARRREDPFAKGEAPGDYALAVGPEGGWSDAERARLEKAGARPLALGSRVLRAETAVFAGLAILQHRLGDLRGA